MSFRPTRLFAGCRPEVAAGPDGRILAVGAAAREAAGADAEVEELPGRTLPGLADAHIHLESLARLKLEVDLAGSPSLDHVLARIRRHAATLPPDAWVVGRGWYNDVWPDARFPDRRSLDEAVAGRPALLLRKDGHSGWVSSAALGVAAITRETPNPPGGVIDRDPDGEASGIVRENAVQAVQRCIPRPSDEQLDAAMAAALRDLARRGLTSVHSMDTPLAFASLSRLRARRPLPLRVSYNLPAPRLEHAERLGIHSGLGDDRLRIWGVKAFLDGSLGSRTAEMVDGSGVPVLAQPELVELASRCATAGLNLCLHAIGDGAVRRALDALEPLAGIWPGWRPRIEHAQCVDPADVPRFRRAGVVASMQPIHAVTDRDLADREWGERTRHAYAWRALLDAGAVLAFGSDAPVEPADPLLGIDAATAWRRRAGWYPDLALTEAQALRAYTWGAAYAAGMEDRLGGLRPGMLCDLTLIRDGRVTATVVGGQLTWRERLRKAPPNKAPTGH
ncbi:MAG TPA: amidohydrolase [Candidatus Dormibacteraeota bacterium]|nr:amidohydrolase [Candidatus Dormibacteraeota bacterium]